MGFALVALAAPGLARAQTCDFSPSTTAPLTLSPAYPGAVITICPTESRLAYGLYNLGYNLNAGVAPGPSAVPMAGNATPTPISTISTTPSGIYNITPTRIAGGWAYAIKFTGADNNGSATTDSIKLWYASGCNTTTGCSPGAYTDSAYIINFNLPPPPTVTLTSNATNGVPYKGTLTLTSTVSGQYGPGKGVGFWEGYFLSGRSLGFAPLQNGQAVFNYSQFTPGPHTVVAEYSGVTKSIVINVLKAVATLLLQSQTSTIYANQDAVLTLSLSPSVSDLPAPTGVINIYEGSTLLRSVPAPTAPQTLTFSGFSAGDHILRAEYAGDNNWVPTQSQASAITVLKLAQNLQITNTFTDYYPRQSVDITTTNSAPLLSTISVMSDNNNCSVSGVTVTFLKAGSCQIIASNAGDRVYTPQSVTSTVTILPLQDPGLAFGPAPSPAVSGTTYTPVVTTNTGAPTPALRLTPASYACTLTNGVVTFVNRGLCEIEAYFSGVVGWSDASVKQSITVLQAPAVVTGVSPVSGPQGGGTTVTLTGQTFDGATAITFDGVPGANFTCTSLTSCSARTPPHGAGSVNVAIVTPGGQSAAATPFNYDKTAPTLTLQASPQSVTYGSSVTLSVSLGNALSAGGSVTFYDNGNKLTDAPVTPGSDPTSPSASATVPTLTGGTHTITAVYNGDANNAGAGGPPVFVTVLPAPQTITFPAPTGVAVAGGSLTLSATASSGLSPTYSTASGSVGCTVSGAVVTFTGAGACIVNADQAGNANYQAAPTVAQTITVKPALTITLTPSGTFIPFGGTLTLTATVTGGVSPSGSVTFTDANTRTSRGPVPLVGGAAVLTIPGLQPNDYRFVAAYGGDSINPQASSAPVDVRINLVPVSISPADPTTGQLVVNTPVTWSFTLTPQSILGGLPPVNGTATVTDSIDGTLASVPVVNGKASVTYSSSRTGLHSIRFLYLGDNQVYGSAQADFTQFVGQAATVTVSDLPNPAYVGDSVTVTATASTGATVVGVADDATKANCYVRGLTVTFRAPGPCTINFVIPATPTTVGVTVPKSTTVYMKANAVRFLTLPPKNPAPLDNPYYVSASSTSGDAPVLSVDNSSAGVCALFMYGNQPAISLDHAGVCTVNATVAAGPSYGPASAQQSFTIAQLGQTIAFNPPARVTLGAAPLALSATATSGFPVSFGLAANSTGCTLAYGVLTFNAAGACVVTADQAGNARYAAAPTVSRAIAVDQVKPTPGIGLTVAPATVQYGDQTTLTATLTGGASPSGTVTFNDNGASIGSGPVNSGAATASVSLRGGAHTLTAVYGGDAANNGAQSTPLTYTVQPTTPQVTVSAASGVIPQPGQSTTLTATVAPPRAGLVVPTGQIQFNDNDALLTVATLDGAGSATVTFTSTTPGKHTITAVYSGDASYAANVNGTVVVTTGKLSQTITTSLSATSGKTGDKVTATGTAPGGPVTVAVDAASNTICALETDGKTVDLNAPGTCLLDFNQVGDATYAPAPQAQVAIPVAPGASLIRFDPPASLSIAAGPYTLTASSTAGPQYPVTFALGPASTGCALAGSTLTLTGLGGCVVTASQAGDATTPAATPVTRTISIVMATPKVGVTASPTTVTFGKSVTLTATFTEGFPNAGKQVFFYNEATRMAIGSAVTDSQGVARLAAPGPLDAGAHVFYAGVVRDANNNDAVSADVTVTVVKADQTITTAVSLTDGAAGVVATASGTAPGGPVTLAVNSAALSVCAVGTDGKSVKLLAPGVCRLDFTQAGSANYNPATAHAIINVGAGLQSILFDPPTSLPVTGGPYTLAANSTAGTQYPVTFSLASGSTGCTLSGATLAFTAVGSCIVTADQAGDATYSAAKSVTKTITVTKAAPSLILFAQGDSVNYGSPTSLQATLSGAFPNVGGRQIDFFEGQTRLGSAATDSAGLAQLTPPLRFSVGSHSIVAAFSGDTNNNDVQSAAAIVYVYKLEQSITFTSPTAATVGGPAVTLTATATSGLPVTFGLASTSTGCALSNGVLTFTAAGTCVVNADQAGNGNYNPAPTVTQSVQVTLKGSPAVSLAVSPSTARYGDPITLIATLAGGNAPTGPVTFYDGVQPLGTVTATGATAALPVILTPGAHSLSARYPGDGKNNQAQSAATSYPVQKGLVKVTVTTNPATVSVGGTIGVTVTVTPLTSGLRAATGSVRITDGAALDVVTLLDPSGSTSSAVVVMAAGSTTYTAAYNGDDYYEGGASGSAVATAVKTDQTIAVTLSATAARVGDRVIVTGEALGGPVTMAVDAASNRICLLETDGKTVDLLTVGTCLLNFDQVGDAFYNPAPHVQITIPVSAGTQAIVFNPPASLPVSSPPYTLTATAGAGAQYPVTFSLAANSQGCTLSGAILTFTGAGSCIVTAEQRGDATGSAPPPVTRTIQITKAQPTLDLTPSSTTIRYGQTLTLTATSRGDFPGPPSSIGFLELPNPVTARTIGARQPNSEGVATIAVPGPLSVGAHVFVATVGPDNNNEDVTSPYVTVTVTKADQTITFTPPSTATVGQAPVTLSATATSGLPATFSLAPTSTGCALSNGVLTFTSAGTCVVNADQAGNGNYNPAPTVTQSVQVTSKASPTVSLAVSPSTARYGDPITLTATLAGARPIGGATIEFLDGAAVVGSTTAPAQTLGAPLVVSYAPTTPFGVGTHRLAAHYIGDADNDQATSPAVELTVSTVSQTITFNPPAGVTYGAAPLDLAPLASSSLGKGFPVTFTLAPGSSGCALSGTVLSFTGAGTCTIAADQAGDATVNVAPAPSVRKSILIARTTPKIVLAPIASPTPFGKSVTLSATLTDAVPAADAAIEFVNGTVSLGRTPLTGAGPAYAVSLVVPSFAVGSHSLAAGYAGDANNRQATSAAVDVTVTKAAQTIRFTGQPAPGVVGQTYAPTARADSGLPVTLSIDARSNGACSLDSAGVVRFLARGHCIIDADQTGDDNYLPAPQAQSTLEVAYAPPLIRAIDPNIGPVSGNTAVTITGSNFDPSSDTVLFGGEPARVASVTPGAISVVTPATATPGPVDVTITHTGGAATAKGAFTYVALQPMTATMTASTNRLVVGGGAGKLTLTFTNPNPLATPSVAADLQIASLNILPGQGRQPLELSNVAGTCPGLSDTAGPPWSRALTFSVAASSTCTVTYDVIGYAPDTVTIGLPPFTPDGFPATTGAGVAFVIVPAAPTIAQVTPTRGPTAGGDRVTIIGTNFAASVSDNAVTFDGLPAVIQTATASQLTVLTPKPATPGPVAVAVTTVGGVASAANAYVYVAAPTVTKVDPARGKLAGGEKITLTGTDFTGATAVIFGGVAATAFTVDSDTQITATAPPSAKAQVVDIRVTAPGGVSAATAADHYAYVSSDATLSALSISAGALTPSFATSVHDYHADVPYSVDRESVTVTTTDPNATVTVAGGTTPVGAASSPIALKVGANPIPVVVTAQDGTTTTTYTVTVNRAVQPPLAGAVSVTVPYGAKAAPLTLALSGGAPTSVSVAQPAAHGQAIANGLAVTYTPNPGYAGPDSFTYTAANTGGTSAAATVTVTVSPPQITVTPTALPAGGAGAAYSQTVTAAGGAAPYAYSMTGALPAGLALDPATGVISGTPTARGDFPITLQARDSSTGTGPFTGSQAYVLSIGAAAIAITPTTVPAGDQGRPYAAVSFQATGGVAPYTGWTVADGALPTGMSLSSAGVLSGTPLQPGVFPFTVQVSDSTGGAGASVGRQAVTLTITAAPPPVAKPKSATTPANAPVTINLTEGDTGLISSVAVASPPSHGTVTVSGTTATYTPALNFFGTDRFDYTDTGIGGTSAPATVTITVTPLPVPTVAPQVATVLAGKPVAIDLTKGATGAPFTGAAISTVPNIGTATVSGTTVTYTAPATASGVVTFGFTLSNPFGVSAPGTVTVTVNPRPFTPTPITIQLAADTTGAADVTKGAVGGPFTAADILTVSPSTAGVATVALTAGSAGVNGSYAIRFTPAKHFTGNAVVTYTLSNAFATSDPGTVTFVVVGRSDPTRDPDVTGLVSAQAGTALRFADAQMENIEQRLESLHQGHNDTRHGVSFQIGEGPRLPGPDESPARQFDDKALHAVMAEQGRFDAPRGDRSGPSGGGPVGGGLTGRATTGRRSVTSPTAMATRPDAAAPGQSGGSADAPADGKSADAATPGANPDNDRWAFWSGGAIDFGLHRERANESKLKFTTTGITIGGDYRLSDRIVAGLALGYGQDTTRIGRSGTQDKATSYMAAVYGSYHPTATTFIDATFGAVELRYDSRRWWAEGAEMEFGKRTGEELFGSLKAAWRIKSGSSVIEPYGKVRVVKGALDGLTETGGVGALTFYRQPLNSLKAMLGLRADHMVAISRSLLVQPRLRIEYQHEFERIGEFTVRYADWLDGPAFTGASDQTARDRLMLGVGADIRTENLTVSFDYKSDVTSGSQTNNQVMAKAAWRFR